MQLPFQLDESVGIVLEIQELCFSFIADNNTIDICMSYYWSDLLAIPRIADSTKNNQNKV
jgi:hypothetical protein